MNNLRIDITNKVVIVDKKFVKPEVKDRRFLCEGGFGCLPQTNGESIYGKWLVDNEEDLIRGRWIESLDEKSTPEQSA
jgi:hypothetical protein